MRDEDDLDLYDFISPEEHAEAAVTEARGNLKRALTAEARVEELERRLRMWREGICYADMAAGADPRDSSASPPSGCDECRVEDCEFRERYAEVATLRRQLDMAAGLGNVLISAGVDYKRELAQLRTGLAGLRRIEVSCGDACEYPMRDSKYIRAEDVDALLPQD